MANDVGLPSDGSSDSLRWKTRSSTVAYTCPGFEIVREIVELPDGNETDFDFLSEPPSVVILPFTVDGEVVMIEEWRQAVKRVNVGLPAGTVEPGDEDLAAAARRELEEETGYVAADIRSMITVEPANGVANAVHHHFVATGCEQTGARSLDADESIRVRTTEYDRLREAVIDGHIRDGRTTVALMAHAHQCAP